MPHKQADLTPRKRGRGDALLLQTHQLLQHAIKAKKIRIEAPAGRIVAAFPFS
jgi:hypothetical protein